MTWVTAYPTQCEFGTSDYITVTATLPQDDSGTSPADDHSSVLLIEQLAMTQCAQLANVLSAWTEFGKREFLWSDFLREGERGKRLFREFLLGTPAKPFGRQCRIPIELQIKEYKLICLFRITYFWLQWNSPRLGVPANERTQSTNKKSGSVCDQFVYPARLIGCVPIEAAL